MNIYVKKTKHTRIQLMFFWRIFVDKCTRTIWLFELAIFWAHGDYTGIKAGSEEYLENTTLAWSKMNEKYPICKKVGGQSSWIFKIEKKVIFYSVIDKSNV